MEKNRNLFINFISVISFLVDFIKNKKIGDIETKREN